VGESEADRFLCIVRHGERVNFEVAEAEARTGLENLPSGSVPETRLNCACGRAVRENLDLRKFGKSIDRRRVVAVFVRDEDRIDLRKRFTDRGQQLGQFANGKSRIDENARFFSLQKGAIARATTAKNAKPNRHGGEQRLKG